MPVIKIQMQTTVLIQAESQEAAVAAVKPRFADVRDLLATALGDETATVIEPFAMIGNSILEGEQLAHELSCLDVEPDFFEA